MENATTLKVVWTDSQQSFERAIDNVDQALELIKELASCGGKNPTMLEFFETGKDASFAIGVGRSHTVLTFQESLDPPYYISIGNENREGVITFYYGNEETEYLLRNVVSIEKGREALVYFVKTRTRPNNVYWETL